MMNASWSQRFRHFIGFPASSHHAGEQLVATLGGALGILLGVIASFAVGEFANWRTDITPQAIFLAVGFAAGIGVFFGFYPARKASRLLPIEALRYE